MSPRIIGPAVGAAAVAVVVVFFVYGIPDTGSESGAVPAPDGAGAQSWS